MAIVMPRAIGSVIEDTDDAVAVASGHPAAALAAVIATALVVALVAPLDVAVFGLLIVGVTHVLLEVRYVVGRYPPAVSGHPAIVLQIGLLLLVVVRWASTQGWGGSAEIVVWAVLVMATLAFVLGGSRPSWAICLCGAVAAVAAAALRDPATWFVLLAHAHNAVAAAFVWDWTRTRPSSRARVGVRSAIVAWIVVVPVALLSGALDQVARLGSHVASSVVPIDATLATVTPPAFRSGAVPARVLAVFAFAQLVHYGVWCWWLPRYAPDVTIASSATSLGRWLRGWRLVVIAAAGTVAVVGAATIGYSDGRTVYTTFAAYHAYLEFPVLIALFAACIPGGRRARTALVAH